MIEAQPASRQAFTEATVPLRREYLQQPVLRDPLFPERVSHLPAFTEGQQFRVYDADEWQRDNGKEGTVKRYSMFTGVYTVEVNGREIMKLREVVL